MEFEIIELKKKLSAEEIDDFNVVFSQRKKNSIVAYIALFLGWFVGAHRFYLKKYISASLIVAGVIATVILSSINIGFYVFAAIVFVSVIDIFVTGNEVTKYNNKVQLNILNELIERRNPEKVKQADPEEIIKENPQILSELSLNNNRLFSLKGNVKNKEIRDCIDALYSTLNSVIRLMKTGKIESYKLEKISKFYLPELVEILKNYDYVETNSFSAPQLLKTVNSIKDIVNKIEINLANIIRETNGQRQENIILDLEVLRKAMTIEGFDNEEIY